MIIVTFAVATMTLFTFTEYVCHKLTQIYSVCRPFLFQCICQPRKISGHVYVYKRYISYLFVRMFD